MGGEITGCYLNGKRHKPKRSETLKIRMSLDKKAYARHSHEVTTLVKPQKVDDDHHIDVTYNFCMDYFDGVVEALHAVKKICADPNVVISASCDDLIHGRVLVYEALKNLDTVIQEIEKRKKDSKKNTTE